jgi:hypothetical protein
MQPVEVAARTLFYRAPDGRIVFRPWGARGPCYLVTESQRTVRARVQLVYYGLMLAAVYYGTLRLGTGLTFGAVLPVTLAGNYLLFWFYSRGLPTTPPPLPASKEYTREQARQGNRAFGKPLIWIMLILSVLMAVVGLWAGSRAHAWGTAVPAVLFFGLCAAVFGWQLRNQ